MRQQSLAAHSASVAAAAMSAVMLYGQRPVLMRRRAWPIGDARYREISDDNVP